MSLQFPVSLEKNTLLRETMDKLGIKESDIRETFTRSSGNGGQNVNKTSTTVHLKHPPSGIEIKCSIYRTQGLNRYKARALLCEKLKEKTLGVPLREKILKQKQKKRQRKRKKDLEKGIPLGED